VSDHVFVGLGNPGKKYEMTRHNLGFLVLKAFAQEQGWKFKEESRFQAHVAKGQSGDDHIYLVLPDTYMNESGRAVRPFLDYYKLGPSHLLVVSDDIALDFGVMRLRMRGSAGGHNGLKSIEEHLKTQHYARLRMGIGTHTEDSNLVDHVLDTFTLEELKELPGFVARGVEALKLLMTTTLTQVMNSVNAKPKLREQTPMTGSGENKHEST
jgi:PTH1 family peptidyl-tRNA hydrolase